ASNAVYGRMQEEFAAQGMDHYYLGTVEAEPSLEDLLEAVKAGSYTKVVLLPLMIVAGDHASNDMAGGEPDSWKSVFEAEGYAVTCILHGLGELPEIQEIFVDHARAAMENLPTDSSSAAGTDKTGADTGEASGESAVPPGLSPMFADALREGAWPIDVDSSSSMFRVTGCTLAASGGTMTAELAMGGTGYLYVYPGTAEEAASASPSDWIPFVETSDGVHTFTIPVSALDAEIPCAAYSKNREQWYDRTLVFRSASLPQDAMEAETIVSAESPGLADGAYTAEVTLNGGSGRAAVASPAAVTVQDGVCTAEIAWNSPNYDYMVIDGQRYEPVNAEGDSVFRIPVASFDRPLTVTADTTAMSQPHEIEYTLLFHASTIREAAR
ncbi:MAG: sirohydrochlorin cobaltochelatase, partial [Oscillibacter sp.]|nr:sirohydrochlorin cobaltochelatase [Oscillibacter sp.]